MNWQILWHPKAAKYVEKLPKELGERVLTKFDDIVGDPFTYLEHFEGDCYKLRIGNYSALIDADFEKKILKVRVFDHRGRIY